MMILRYAAKSLARRPLTAALLVLGLGVAFGLPGAAHAVLKSFEHELIHRADVAALVLGAPGSRADLVLHALYFRTLPPGEITLADRKALDRQELATTAALCVQATARQFPVVGTEGRYFEWRRLRLATGEPIRRIGDCVLGAEAARRLDLSPDDRLVTDPDNIFSPSGGVPVRLHVTGVMQATGSADDGAVFVSLETAWLIAGLGHVHGGGGSSHQHDDSGGKDAEAGVIAITDDNVDSFHFHGNRDRFPLTAVLARPKDAQAKLLLVGRYLDRDGVQLAEADRVLRDLLDMALRLRRLIQMIAAVTSTATLLLCFAVVTLTMRLRWSEVRTMHRIGLSRTRIAAIFSAEFALVAVGAAVFAAGIIAAASFVSPALFRWLVL